MSLPDSPNTTYVAGSTPAIKADDLNAMQAAIVAMFAHNNLLGFGDGSDGDVIYDGVTFPAWATGGVQNRDPFCRNLTINAGTLQTAGFRIYCSQTLSVTNAAARIIPSSTGMNGVTITGATGFPTQSIAGAVPGGNGGVTVGSDGTLTSQSYGGSGGAGGVGTGGGRGAGGVATPPATSHGSVLRPYNAATFGALTGGGVIVLATGGGGGGGGGGDGSLKGSGGGAGGGVIAIAARNIVLASALNLEAFGGDGAPTTLANFGAGGGGGGGMLLLAYQTLTITSGSLSAATNCRGGLGGTGPGSAGTNGLNGSVQQLQL
jgi:hypothetical protein